MADAPSPVALSACIIARNEAVRLPDCLRSVAFCDEIVLVDSGSSDDTVAIARAAGATVVEQPWLGYAGQRNVSLDHAHGVWALEIDADERVSPQLAAEITEFVRADRPEIDLGGLPLREHFLGHRLERAGQYPKYRHRLIRRSAYRHDERRTVHEGLVPVSEVHPFSGDLDHELAATWREAWADVWSYSRLEAGQLTAARTAKAIVGGALLRPTAKLGYRVVVDQAWRDGWAGVAKVWLDSVADAIVWVRHALGRRGAHRGVSGVDSGAHFGSWRHHRGTVRLVGVALGAGDARAASEWLEGAARDGDDVVLVSDQPSDAIRLRALANPRPRAVIRALQAEDQLRTADAIVAFGPRAERVLRYVPGRLLGGLLGVVAPDDGPAAIRERALDARGQSPTAEAD